jgi:hypothetical protein
MGVTKSGVDKSEEMAMKRTCKLNWKGLPLLGFLLLASTGCRDMVGEAIPPTKQVLPPIQPVSQGSPPGLHVNMAGNDVVVAMIHSTTTVPRNDIWALHSPEQDYDVRARNEQIFSTKGGLWPTLFTPKPEFIEIDQIEPQPFRRLAGVLVGDSVMAIIDMGDGSPMQVIRPGMQIPNSPWKVISIDEEKATLHRNGNKRPKDIVVRLQGPVSPGFNPSPGIGNAPNPGGNPGGPPARGRGSKTGGAVGGGGGGIQ